MYLFSYVIKLWIVLLFIYLFVVLFKCFVVVGIKIIEVVKLLVYFDRVFICNVVFLEFKKMWVFFIVNFVVKFKWFLKVDVINREYENIR